MTDTLLSNCSNNERSEWYQAFRKNSKIIPPPGKLASTPFSTHTSNHPTTSPNSPTVKDPFKQQLSSPFTLTLDKLDSLLIPSIISDAYIQGQGPLMLQWRASLFDVEANEFFGKTWKSQEVIDLRRDEDSRDKKAAATKRSKRSEKPKVLEQRKVRVEKSTNLDNDNSTNDSDNDSSDENGDSDSQQSQNDDKTSTGKATLYGRRMTVDLTYRVRLLM